jgi:hypothetical protein
MEEKETNNKKDFVSTTKDFFADGKEMALPREDILVPHKPENLTQEQPRGSFEKITTPNITTGNIPSFRTYKQDVADAVRDQKTSLVRMVLEEQKGRRRREEEVPTSKKNLPLIFLSVFFFFSAAIIIYYLFFRLNPLDQTLLDLHVSPIMFVEKTVEIPIEGKHSNVFVDEIAKTIQMEDFKIDTVEYFLFTETFNIKTNNGITPKKDVVSAGKFFEVLKMKIPSTLLRSLRPEFMFGVHSFNKNQPFLVLKSDYYDNAFAGMFEWEKNLPADIFPIFNRVSQVKELSQRSWGDRVIKNKDTRVLLDFNGYIALVYSFKDRNTLIITTSEDTLLEVSRRLDLVNEKSPE